MKAFLQELAEKIYSDHPKLDEVTLVFPNRRAIIYFQKYLSDVLTKPVFSPHLLTIEEFIGGFSSLKVPDKLELIHRLHQSYASVMKGVKEPFDQFYFWGEMLLRDFDEADKYLVRADHLFKDLSTQKELESIFDYFTEEHLAFLKDFWQGFEENQTKNKKKFLQIWKELPHVYRHFNEQLRKEGLAYEGMLHREVAEGIASGKIQLSGSQAGGKLYFIGFNALTGAEDLILSTLVEKGLATLHWDVDAYYINNEAQEAGKFFREYQARPALGRTFLDPPANFLKGAGNHSVKEAKIFGAPQPVAQAKLLAQILQEQLAQGMHPEETLVVLPDEKLLLPVLHGISGGVEKLNVTMGFPLSSTPMYNLIELLVELQLHRRGSFFNHRQVLAVLGHPYVIVADIPVANARRKEILKDSWISIPQGYLAAEVQLHRLIFNPVDHVDESRPYLIAFIEYLKSILLEIGSLNALSDLDKEYVFHFLKMLNRLGEINIHDEFDPSNKAKETQAVLKSFLRLFRQLVRSQKIPFTGEPLRGLQVMGVLETRNLDFKNVFVLSLNEGAFPAMGGKGSFIPYNIRRAYQLPTVEHSDAMYAYLFYRVLQRAENIFLFYNTETDVLGQGEMSRYLQQLIYESGLRISRTALHNPIKPKTNEPITILKDDEILAKIALLNEGKYKFKGISPSALNTYIDCALKFYLRHVAEIKEPKKVEEDLDARMLGNFLHDVMEKFYRNILQSKRRNQVEAGDFENHEAVLDRLIDEAFRDAHNLDPNKKIDYRGQRVIVREIVRQLTHRIVKRDMRNVPFSVEAIEQQGMTYILKIDHAPGYAVIGGKIDRVDRKDDLLRIVDYKSGRDKDSFDSIASLFERVGKKRNTAAFQILLYTLLYMENLPVYLKKEELRIVPGLLARANLFHDDPGFGLKMKKEPITDVRGLMPEFESLLKLLVEDLFNPAVPFDQTTNLETCTYCPYKEICGR